ncbi:hypothetical protein ACOI1A_09650, partial [Corynebacterium glutamicum]|uniref:hypothetical protein n=1 Tax=Corynebacterium glutamicum TaxID=1718 RepID=UPI003B5A2A39
MTITFSRVALATLAATATALSLSVFANAEQVNDEDSVDARQCIDANNVWVYVEYGEDSEKEPEGACATNFATGFDALESAGFQLDYDQYDFGRFLTGINGVSPDFHESGTYWSYFSGEVADDYSVEYSYYSVGASTSEPQGGSVEAWVVGTGQENPALDILPTSTEPTSTEPTSTEPTS